MLIIDSQPIAYLLKRTLSKKIMGNVFDAGTLVAECREKLFDDFYGVGPFVFGFQIATRKNRISLSRIHCIVELIKQFNQLLFCLYSRKIYFLHVLGGVFGTSWTRKIATNQKEYIQQFLFDLRERFFLYFLRQCMK